MRKWINLKIWRLSLSMCLQLLGLYLVFVGLIGMKKENLEVTPIPLQQKGSGRNSTQTQTYAASIDKVVLIVIDALRVDFLSRTTMPNTSTLLDRGYGCSFIANVKSPTVTLPRIKALLTGDVSTYWDIIENFNSRELNQDNFIWHATKDAKKKIVFYGDETWMALFPTEFIRSEGVTSFYVTDYTEVDNNVTRHLIQELRPKANWDMLILHYLGLDHIGHIQGPSSPLILNKLQEMDNVVKRVHDYLRTLESRSLLIVCGDHGMANIGGHGGNSYHEIKTPLLVFSTEQMQECVRKNWENSELTPEVEQIDVATTLSAFWGLMFPASSAGKYISSIFGHLKLTERLFIANYNAIHLAKFFGSSNISSLRELDKLQTEYFKLFQNDADYNKSRHILAQYEDLLTRLSKSASEQLGEQNKGQMILGILLCFASFLIFHIHAGICDQIKMKMLPKVSASEFTFASSKESESEPSTSLQWLRLVHYLTPLFCLSSSFIEEEHYIRYYLLETGIMCLNVISPEIRQLGSSKGSQAFGSIIRLLVLNRIAAAWNQTGQKWSHQRDLADIFSEYGVSPYLVGFTVGVLQRQGIPKFRFDSFTCTIFVAWIWRKGIHDDPDFRGDIINWVPVIILCFTLLHVILSYRKGVRVFTILTNVWMILTFMLQKYENIPLAAFAVVMAMNLRDLLKDLLPSTKRYQEAKTILILWFTYAAFFYQGNSNSIASIDVNAGYIGLTSYNETLVGFLIFCNTFSLPVLIIMVYFFEENSAFIRNKEISINPEIDSFFLVLCKTNSVTVSIYAIVISVFRHHLFVWSVFVPKLLYVIAYTFLYTIITLIYGISRSGGS